MRGIFARVVLSERVCGVNIVGSVKDVWLDMISNSTALTKKS
jgi:hypothetical protein